MLTQEHTFKQTPQFPQTGYAAGLRAGTGASIEEPLLGPDTATDKLLCPPPCPPHGAALPAVLREDPLAFAAARAEHGDPACRAPRRHLLATARRWACSFLTRATYSGEN